MPAPPFASQDDHDARPMVHAGQVMQEQYDAAVAVIEGG